MSSVKKVHIISRFRDNNASLEFGRTSAGIVWCFLGALQHYLRTLCLCSHLIRGMQYRVLRKCRYQKILQRDLAPNPDLSSSSYHKDLFKGHRIKSTYRFCSFFSAELRLCLKNITQNLPPPNTPTNRQLYLVNGGEWWWIASLHQQNISIRILKNF